MRIKGPQISIGIVCLILGIMLAVQFRTQETSPTTYLAATRYSELTVQLDKLRSERDALVEEVESLRDKLNKTAANQEGAVAQAMNEERIKNQMAAGMTAVSGPGVVVTLTDRLVGSSEDPNNDIIHDQDLLMVVNELKAAGAEAISINDNRIIAMSEIRCAGTTILVNGNKIGPPFIIKSIGDPDIIQSSLLIPGGYVKYLEQFGIHAQIEKLENVEIPAYKGSIKFEYAEPVKQES